MTELKGKIHGRDETLLQTPGHYLLSALNDFLVAEYPDKMLGATIQLSIGIETFIKSKLEAIDPSFIQHNINWNRWKAIRRPLHSLSVADKQAALLTEFTSARQLRNGSTIDFARAIEIFHLVKPQSITALRDLKKLRDYRNGLFHWKAETTSSFELSKLCLRIFLWLYEEVKSYNDGHMLSDEVIIFDPLLQNYKKLKRLQELVNNDNENAFNFERRVFKYHEQYTLIFQSQSRLRGDIIIPEAIPWKHKCPACGFHQMQMYEIGTIRDGVRENRDVVANCNRCDFSATSKEQEHMISEDMPTLLEIFDELRASSPQKTKETM